MTLTHRRRVRDVLSFAMNGKHEMKILSKILLITTVMAFNSAHAIVLLDQDAKVQPVSGLTYLSSTSVSSGLSGWDLLQTFTAGRTGTLSAVALQTYQSSGPPIFLTLSLYVGNGTDPGILPIGQTTFNNTQSGVSYDAGGMVLVDVSSIAFNVTSGSLYSYSISTAHDVGLPASASRFLFSIGLNNPDGTFVINDYPGGRAYRRTWVDGTTPGWEISRNFATDRGFQTYVDVSVVPEISTNFMLAVGVFLILLCRNITYSRIVNASAA